MVLEYKFFEPAFYHTDVPDVSTSLMHCLALGEQAQVLTPATTPPARTSSSSRRPAAAAEPARGLI